MMIERVKTGLIVLCILLLNLSIRAQSPDWKKETTKDGKVSVSYNFTEGVDQNGKKYNMLEYEAVTTANASLGKCREVMMDETKHMEFMEGTQDVKRVMDLPGGEWVTYYFLNSRWPMPDSDVITRYRLEEDPSGKRFILTGTPAPDLYPEGDVPRMKHNLTKYTFTDLGNGKIELVMYSQSIPLVSVPKWLIATWIPDGPADMLNGIIRLANE
jgi:hypothetical protein